jgi:hypothetical protein
MATSVVEMTLEDLKALILEAVQEALAETMGGPGWQAEWRELVAHQRHLSSLYAEFADEDTTMAEAGMSEYATLLTHEDNAT